jgi:hypothetical protein
MKAAIISIADKNEEKALKTFFRKNGIKARIMKHQEMEDAVFAALIDSGMKTRDVSEQSVMKALRQK